jgi:hypothetical protein
MSLLGPETSTASVAEFLRANHYLGAVGRGFAYEDEFGIAVFANPSSRYLPQQRWLELIRWCLVGVPNGGSQQWKRIVRWLKVEHPEVTTVVSYSDPSQGHTGALYKASNWRWAPTWHRLRPPPTGNGSWDGDHQQSVKDRWVYVLQSDPDREEILRVKDDALETER